MTSQRTLVLGAVLLSIGACMGEVSIDPDAGTSGGGAAGGGSGGMGGGGQDSGWPDAGSSDAGRPDAGSGTRVLATVREVVVGDITQGWCSTVYVPTLQRFLAIFVNHYSPSGYQNNSLRAFDPATSTVEYVHPKDVPGAPQDRDNHQMVYNPTLNQVWILGGHDLLDVAQAWAARSTPPSYGAVAWTGPQTNAQMATRVKDWPTDFRKWNAVVDWHPTKDIGVIWGGVAYTGMGVSNDLYLLKPNPAGPEPYQFVNAGNYDAELAPPGYVKNYIYTTTFNGRHNGRILGDFLYTLTVDNTQSLTALGNGRYTVTVDLLRFDVDVTSKQPLQRMRPLVYEVSAGLDGGVPAADTGMNFPCVTADTDRNLLLVYLALAPPHNLWAYLVDRDEWVEVEPDVAPGYRRLAACDYSPDHQLHAYQDGQSQRTSNGWGTIKLERL